MRTAASIILILLALNISAQIAEIEGSLTLKSSKPELVLSELSQITGSIYSEDESIFMNSEIGSLEFTSNEDFVITTLGDNDFSSRNLFLYADQKVEMVAEDVFTLNNNFGEVIRFDSTGRVSVNSNIQGLSDLHINQSGGDQGFEGTGGLNLQRGTAHWRIYSDAINNTGLRFNYSGNDGDSYIALSYIDHSTGEFMELLPSMSKSFDTNISVLSNVLDIGIGEFLVKTAEANDQKLIGMDRVKVRKYFPQLVRNNSNGELAINYSKFGVVAMKAIQEQHEIINSQANEIDLLKRKNQELENRLTKLEAMFESAFK